MDSLALFSECAFELQRFRAYPLYDHELQRLVLSDVQFKDYKLLNQQGSHSTEVIQELRL